MKEVQEAKKDLEKKIEFLDSEYTKIIAESSEKYKPKQLLTRDKTVQESLNKVTKEWQVLQEKRTERMNLMIEETRKQEEKLRIAERNENDRLKQEKVNRIAQRIENIQKRMKDREILSLQEKEEMKDLLKQTPKTIKYLKEVQKHEENEEKERIEGKLAEIKEKYKPISKEDLETHAKSYDELLKKIQAERLQKTKNNINNFKPSYKSPLHEIIESQEHEKNQEKIDEIHKKQEMIQKLKDYHEKVRKEHYPEIDPQKKQTIKDKIFKLKHPAFKFFIPKDLKSKALTEDDINRFNSEKSPNKIGKDYLIYAKTHKKIHANTRSLEKIPETETLSLKNSKYENYLHKIHGLGVKKDDLSDILKDEKLSKKEKKEKIFMQAGIWENEAERKELLMKIKGTNDLNELTSQADDLRLKAIKAKLAYLQNSN